jgi:hypothetical protein
LFVKTLIKEKRLFFDYFRIYTKEITLPADELKVNPRRFFIFSIKPFNEVTLTNAEVKIYLDEGKSSNPSLLAMGKDILSIDEQGRSRVKALGLITRGKIEGLDLQIYAADRLWLIIRAKEATVDFRNQRATLVTASIENKLSNHLSTRKSLVWSCKEDVFTIPGACELGDPVAQVKQTSFPTTAHEP